MVYETKSIVLIVVILLWLPQAIYQVVVWTYWYQVKEYRFDRFWLFLNSHDGFQKLGISKIITKIIAIALINTTVIVPLVVLFSLDAYLIRDIIKKRVRKPVITKRIKNIWLTTIFGIFLTLASFFLFPLISLLIGELLLALSIYLGILWTIPIVSKVKKEEVIKAMEVLEKVKPTVIGITGSFGKTTTKDFVSHLLAQKYKVSKTSGSENTEFGVARNTQKSVLSDTDFFVVEMGAYKKGEISKIANIVRPKIGIITGIEEQHLSLFGSLDNIKAAKFELIESLPSDGIAIFNFNNRFSRELYNKTKTLGKSLKVMGYFVGNKLPDFLEKPDILIVPTKFSSNKTEFELNINNEIRKLEINFAGIHFLQNISVAILIAREFGISWKLIKNGLISLQPPYGVLNVYALKNNITVIDDSKNSSPSAFSSALDYLLMLDKDRKIVITSGIIELGGRSNFIHSQLGKKMRSGVNNIFLTNWDFYDSLRKGLGKYLYKLKVIDDNSAGKIIQKIKTEGNSIILLEGRLPLYITDNFKN